MKSTYTFSRKCTCAFSRMNALSVTNIPNIARLQWSVNIGTFDFYQCIKKSRRQTNFWCYKIINFMIEFRWNLKNLVDNEILYICKDPNIKHTKESYNF